MLMTQVGLITSICFLVFLAAHTAKHHRKSSPMATGTPIRFSSMNRVPMMRDHIAGLKISKDLHCSIGVTVVRDSFGEPEN
jgi:hypothetical protein